MKASPTKRASNKQNSNRKRAFTFILSFLYAFFLVYGLYFKFKGSGPTSLWILAVFIVIATFAFYWALTKLWRFIDTHSFHTKFENSKKLVVVSSAIILISWIVVWFASWPGYYAYDTNFYTDYIQNGTINNMQSVFFTLLVGNILKAGMYLFGNFNGAVAFYVGIQTAICYIFVIYVLKTMVKMQAPRVLFVVSVIYLATCPSISLYVLCTTKDTLFSLILIAFSLNSYFVVKGEEQNRITSRLVFFAIFAFLVIVLRDNGIYAIVPSVILLFILINSMGHRKKAVFVTLACTTGILLAMVWTGPVVTNCFNTTSSNPMKQMISIPAAQLANAAATDSEFDTSKLEELGVDRDTLVILYENHPDNSDAFRVQFWDAIESGKFARFLQIWVEELPSHPRAYAEAFLELTECAWSPFDYIHCYNFQGNTYFDGSESSVFFALCEAPAQTDSKLPGLYNVLWDYSRNNPLTAYPLFAWTSSVAFFVWLFLLLLTRAFIKKNKPCIVFCVPMLFVVLTCLLGPTVLIRYYWFLFLSAPLLVTLLITKDDRTQQCGNNSRKTLHLKMDHL